MPTGKKFLRRSRPPPETADGKNDATGNDKEQRRDVNDSGAKKNSVEMVDRNERNGRRKGQFKKGNAAESKKSYVSDSDLEELPLLAEDIESFISGAGPSGDPFDSYFEGTRVQWEYQSERRGGHVLFIEDEETGELVPTDINGEGTTLGTNEQDNDYETSSLLRGEDGDVSLQAKPDISTVEEFNIMEKFFMASYIFFQGLFAGFSLALIYIVERAESDRELLLNYQPSANEIRRILFIFGAASVVGSLESFNNAVRCKRNAAFAVPGSRDTSSSNTSSKEKNLLRKRKAVASGDNMVTSSQLDSALVATAWVVLICYFTAFIVLLIMASSDVLISKRNGYDEAVSDEWANLALEDDQFDRSFQRWKLLSLYRLVFAVMGWIGACVVVLLRYLISSKRDIAMHSMLDFINVLRKKISHLQGDSFDSDMTVDDYRRLIKIQKLGIQRSENALKALEEQILEDHTRS